MNGNRNGRETNLRIYYGTRGTRGGYTGCRTIMQKEGYLCTTLPSLTHFAIHLYVKGLRSVVLSVSFKTTQRDMAAEGKSGNHHDIQYLINIDVN